MAVKTGWHRYGTKLRHCHPVYTDVRCGRVASWSVAFSTCWCCCWWWRCSGKATAACSYGSSTQQRRITGRPGAVLDPAPLSAPPPPQPLQPSLPSFAVVLHRRASDAARPPACLRSSLEALISAADSFAGCG